MGRSSRPSRSGGNTTCEEDGAAVDGELQVFQVSPDRVGIVAMLGGRPLPTGDVAGPPVSGHDSFQRGQAFIDAGGCRGLQDQVLLSGAWNLDPWFAKVEQVPTTEVPIGSVGAVFSSVGKEHLDVSGADFTHGDLVERGRKAVLAFLSARSERMVAISERNAAGTKLHGGAEGRRRREARGVRGSRSPPPLGAGGPAVTCREAPCSAPYTLA